MNAPHPDCVTVLTDGVVTLRAHRPGDVARMVQQCRDPLMVRWTTVPRPYAVGDAETFLGLVRAAWLEPTGLRAWAVTDDTDAFLGTLELRPHGPAYTAAFGLHPQGRGRGLMARALALACGWAFGQGAPLVRWDAFVGNWASRRTAWACGFTIHGTDRGHGYAGTTGLRDAWVGSLAAAEPMAPSHPWLRPATLEGERVGLRAFGDDDQADLPDTSEPGIDRAPARAEYDAWVLRTREQAAEGRALTWCLADRHTDAVLGAVRLGGLADPARPGTAHLGYWLLAGHRGHGYVHDALDLLVPHAFGPAEAGGLGLTRIAAAAHVDNLASQRTLYAAGWRPCGTEGSAARAGALDPVEVVAFELLVTDDRAAQRVRPLPVPVLHTERLRLRPWGPGDGPGPGDEPDEAALAFMPAHASPSPGSFPEWLAQRHRRALCGDAVSWCIADRHTDRALGSIAVFAMGPEDGRFQGEVGYWLYPSVRGRRTIAEVLPLVVDHAFRPVADGGLGLSRLQAGTDAANEPSQAVLRAAGFREWGRASGDYRRADGTPSDSVYLALLATDARGMTTQAAPARTHNPPAVSHAVT